MRKTTRDFFLNPKFIIHASLFIVLIVLGFLTHFLFLSYPSNVVWDETYYSKFSASYVESQDVFDIHPPLGKLILASGIKLFGYKARVNPDDLGIGKPYPDNFPYIGLRFFPALFGGLLASILYLILINLGINRIISFFGGLMLIFENSILVSGRVGLMDNFILFFGLLSILLAVLSVKTKKFNNILWPMILVGLAGSVKWTGFGYIFFPLMLAIFLRKSFKFKIYQWMLLLSAPFMIYFLIFTFKFLTLSYPSLFQWDNKLQQNEFIKIGDRTTLALKNPILLVGGFFAENLEMFNANLTIKQRHQNESKWYQWPIGGKSIFYYSKESNKIYQAPNKTIYFAVLISIIIGLILFFKKRQLILGAFLTSYFLNLILFFPVSRPMFIYHYFTALVFGIVIFAFVLDWFKQITNKRVFTLIYFIALAGFILNFVYLLPTTYGF